ncbi:uncharacterized protein BP5553_07359 [Venustampulla echinocandica]|uniref:GAR domain-containing protein n=1 Tax=Venustampulla echinocandica TaxID=2656787 RepID=A0A370TJA4_9HELO|nr:uncharacterized protein BP5553_07359 [Venustampulla echinocandica]RDL35428.1 hypothetical protein BP5553_07359 [Venustampulla echinocandica]
MDVPLLLSPTAPRLHPYRTHIRNASRSPTRERITDDILADLSPATTLEAFANPSGRLKAGIEAATPSERAFAIRATLASKKIQEWVDELSSWSWPAEGGSRGFRVPVPRRTTWFDRGDDVRGMLSGYEQNDNRQSDKEEYIGSLLAEDVDRYEVRIEEIMEDMDDLNVEEIKRQVLDTHFSARSRPSSSSSNAPVPSLLASYTKMDDLTAIITATVLQALPNLSRLNRMMDIWSIRLAVLMKVPRLLLALEDAEAALISGWKTLKPPSHQDTHDANGGAVKALSRQAFEAMRNSLQDKVKTLGQDLDYMLDTLEGRQDTLPEDWLDRMEVIEQDYGEWVVAGDRKIREAEWAKEQSVEDARRLREAEIGERERRIAEQAAEDARLLEKERVAQEDARHRVEQDAEMRRLDEQRATELAQQNAEQAVRMLEEGRAAQEARHKSDQDAEEMRRLGEQRAAQLAQQKTEHDEQAARILVGANNKHSGGAKAACVEVLGAEKETEEGRTAEEHAGEAIAATHQLDQIYTEATPIENKADETPVPQQNETTAGEGVSQTGCSEEPEALEGLPGVFSEALRGVAEEPASSNLMESINTDATDDHPTHPAEPDQDSQQVRHAATPDNKRSANRPSRPSFEATVEEPGSSEPASTFNANGNTNGTSTAIDTSSMGSFGAFIPATDCDISIATRRDSVSSDTATIVTSWAGGTSTSPAITPTPVSTDIEYVPNIADQSPTAGRIGSRRRASGDSNRPEPLQLILSTSRRQSMESPASPTFSVSDLSDTSTLYVDAPVLDNIDVSEAPSLSSPKKSSSDQLQQQISSLLESIPARIHLTSEPDLNPGNTLKLKKTRRSVTPSPRSHSSLSNRAPTPSFLLSPAYNKTTSRPRPQTAHPEIKLYHLSRSTGEAPIKLFVRLVGESGERVMVRVGGGWADLGEYLKEYASHHGRRSGVEKDKIEIQDIPRRVVSSASTTSSTATIRGNESGRASPINQFRPASAFDRPMSSLNVRKTRKSLGQSAVSESVRSPSTPLPTHNRRSVGETPPSNTSARSSSHLTWTEDDISLGLAGPKGKKVIISEQDQEWVESMKDKVRQASAEKDRERERERRARERGTSFGEMEKVGGTKRLFKKS